MLLVTGASGFVGSAVVRAALGRGLAVRAMVRPTSDLGLLAGVPGECIVRAEMEDTASLDRAVAGDVTAVVHCAATTSSSAPDLALSRRVNVEGTRRLVAACLRAHVHRFVQISSQSAHSANPSVYGQTKMEQDAVVRGALGLDWTILKPSIVYGPQAKGIFDKMVDYCRRLPVIPIIGMGREEMRPIHVDDVAEAALACLDEPRTVEREYDLGGEDALSFNDFIGEILRALGRSAWRFHLPVPIAMAIARALSLVMQNPPLTPDNVRGIQTVRHVDIAAARRDFRFAPRGFAEGLRAMWGAPAALASPPLPSKNVRQAGKPAPQALPVAQAFQPAKDDSPVAQAFQPAKDDSPVAQAFQPAKDDSTTTHAYQPVPSEHVRQAGKPAPQMQAGEPAPQPLRVALIGLGKIGLMHASMCHSVPGVELAALVDVRRDLGSQTQSWGVTVPFYESLDALLAATGQPNGPRPVDAAIVATPQFTHRRVAVECLERGLHVLCEKPLAHTLDDARAMVEAAGRHPGRVTAVGFMKGHYPLWLEAARRLRTGWIGEPRRFRATIYLSQVFGPRQGWTFTPELSGGGIVINSGIHLLQFLRVLFGDAARVTALARPMHSAVEDTLAALIEFRSGVFGSYDTSWSVPGYPTEGTTVLVEGDDGVMEITDDYLRTFHLTGKGKMLACGTAAPGCESHTLTQQADPLDGSQPRAAVPHAPGPPRGWSRTHRAEFDHAAFTASPDYGGEGWYNQIADFARAIREGRPARYDWTEGLRVQEMIDGLYRSARTKESVTL